MLTSHSAVLSEDRVPLDRVRAIYGRFSTNGGYLYVFTFELRLLSERKTGVRSFLMADLSLDSRHLHHHTYIPPETFVHDLD